MAATTIEWPVLYLKNVLILRDAEPEQLDYIRRYYMERWANEQKDAVHTLVEEAKKHIDESGFATSSDWMPNLVWFSWVERYICNRFQYMLRWEWVDAFAMLDDEALTARKLGEKALLYLRFTRDFAKKTRSIIGDGSQRRFLNGTDYSFGQNCETEK